MSLQNLETYVVLVSYNLWCFSFFISEAVLLSLEDFPFVLALVVEYLCTEAETICLLGHLLKLNQSTNQSNQSKENSRIKKHPSLKCPSLMLCGEDRYTMLPHQL